MTTVAATILVATTIPADRTWLRLGGYCLYWLSCALAFVPVVHASDRVVRTLNKRLEHVATDESLLEELIKYRKDLDSTFDDMDGDGRKDR